MYISNLPRIQQHVSAQQPSSEISLASWKHSKEHYANSQEENYLE
jgi:hypothetical protein